MKININRIQPEGLILREEALASQLDLETDIIKFRSPLSIEAEVSRITNAVTVNLALRGLGYARCSRCLDEFEIDFRKNLRLNYPVEKSDTTLDLDPDIREEIILDYPIKPLCSPGCKGLCSRCGKNLNEGSCNCVQRNKHN